MALKKNGDKDSSTDGVRSLLYRFAKNQECRVAQYNIMHETFRRYLNTQEEGPYVKCLTDSTSAFSAISADVIAVERRLSEEYGASDIADIIRNVQEVERDKLRVTLSLQALRKVYEFRGFSWQRDDYAAKSGHDCAGHGDMTARMAFMNLAGTALGSSACRGAVGEPTEGEYKLAVAEAIQHLEKAINQINDSLEEIRYIRAELEGD